MGKAFVGGEPMNAFLHLTPHCRSPTVLISFQM